MTLQTIAETLGLTVAQLTGIFNVLAGLMLITSVGLIITGYTYYMVYMGLPRRATGSRIMLEGTRVLFALVLMLAVTNFVTHHISMVLAGLLVAIVLFLIYSFFNRAPAPKEDDDDHEH